MSNTRCHGSPLPNGASPSVSMSSIVIRRARGLPTLTAGGSPVHGPIGSFARWPGLRPDGSIGPAASKPYRCSPAPLSTSRNRTHRRNHRCRPPGDTVASSLRNSGNRAGSIRKPHFFVIRGREHIGCATIGVMGAATDQLPGSVRREIFVMMLGLLVVVFVATVLFRGPARSSPQGRQPVPVFGSNPGVRGQGGR